MVYYYSVFLSLLLLPLLPLKAQNPAHLDTALAYVGVTELTNHNDGPEVEKFLKSVGRHKGDAWCAAFVSACLTYAHVVNPSVRSGLARSFKTKKSVNALRVLEGQYIVPVGSIVGWQNGTTISGHTGFTREVWKGVRGKTVEGNTSSGLKGSQDNGDGVYNKNRSIQPANYFRLTWFLEVEDNPIYKKIDFFQLEPKPLTTLETFSRIFSMLPFVK